MKLLKVIAISLGMVLASTSAKATVLTDGVWDSFSFGATGTTVGETWTFTVADGMSLFVTDAYCIGDRFSVFSSGSLLGDTSTTGAATCGTSIGDAQTAYDSGLYSTGEFGLAAGTYSISISMLASPFSGGGAWIKIDQSINPTFAAPVPEAASLILLSLGLLGFAGLRRKA